MEFACSCPVCPELSRSLKKFERRLSEECKWNLAQGQYCNQLQEEMQRNKDLCEREEHKLRENLQELNNKIENLYKTIQVQHKEQTHLQYQNEVLEDQKQELQEKVAGLKDKVKNLCADMGRAQYRARMLEEKLRATSKYLEESQVLKARISQAENQKARLETKVSRLQEEKQHIEDELNNVKNNNCQMQMQMIELQQKLACLDTRTQQMEASQLVKKKSDSSLANHCSKHCNRACIENNDFTTHKDENSMFKELNVPTKEMEYKDRDIAAFQSKRILKWQTASHNSSATAINQVTEICALAPMDVADNATECCDLDIQFMQDSEEENIIKGSWPTSEENQENNFLDGEIANCINPELNDCKTCLPLSYRNETQMNILKKDLENIHESPPTTTVSESEGIMREISIISSDGCISNNGSEHYTETLISTCATNATQTSFTDKAEKITINNHREASMYINACCMNPSKNQSSRECESLAPSDKEMKHILPDAKNTKHFKTEKESTCCYTEKQDAAQTTHPKITFSRTCVSQAEECCNTNIESTFIQQSVNRSAISLVNTEAFSELNSSFGPSEIKEYGCTECNYVHTKDTSQNEKVFQSQEESIIERNMSLKGETSATDSPDSVNRIEKEALTNSNKKLLSILNKKTNNKIDNQTVKKKNKPLYNKCCRNENKDKVNEVNKEDSLNLKECPPRVSPRRNKGSSSSEKSSQTASPRSNGLNRSKLKLNSLNKKCKTTNNKLLHKGNMPQCRGNNQSKAAAELINNSNGNDVEPKSYAQQYSKNIQTESEKMSENTTFECEINNKGNLNSEKSLETIYNKACESNKNKITLSASNKNNNNNNNIDKAVKYRNVSCSNKSIQTDSGTKPIALNKHTVTENICGTCKPSTTQCSNAGNKYIVLNRNNHFDSNVIYKKYTHSRNRHILSDNGTSAIDLNKNNSENDSHLVHKNNVAQCDKNETCTTVHFTAVIKSKTKMNIAECNKGTQSAVQSVALKTNSIADDNVIHEKNTIQDQQELQSENKINFIALIKDSNKLVCKNHPLQCSKGVQNETVMHSVLLSEYSNIVNGDLKQEKNIIPQSNKNTHDEDEIQSIVVGGHGNIVADDLKLKKKISQSNEDIQNEDGIQSFASSKTNNITDDKLIYKINKLQQCSCSSSTYDDLVQDKEILQSNKGDKCEKGVQCDVLNKYNGTANGDLVHIYSTTKGNKDVQSKNGVHPSVLNKSVIDGYFTYGKNSPQCQECEMENNIQPIAPYKLNCSVVDNGLIPKNNIPYSNGCVQSQYEIQLIDLDKNKNIVNTDLLHKNNAMHYNCTENGRQSNVPNLEVLHEAENLCMFHFNTSSGEVCNNMFDYSIRATKPCIKLNSFSSSEGIDLFSAAREGKFSDVEKMLSQGTCPNSVYDGNTALHVAAQTGNLPMCRLLLEGGARVDARNNFSSTPLHAAANCGNLEVGKLLMSWGASVVHRDKAGNLASDIAINNGHLHMYHWLRLQEQLHFQRQ